MTVLGNLGRLNETYSTGRFEYIYELCNSGSRVIHLNLSKVCEAFVM